MAPILLAMTAATPILKGRLADTDVRWGTIVASVDDRTLAEKGLVPDAELEAAEKQNYAGKGVRRIPKSRYDSISTYLYHCRKDLVCNRSFAKFNDVLCPVDDQYKKMLMDNGIDANLAHHVAHLFIRDPLVIFEGAVELDDRASTDHFENIQSTNWQTVRWKPPPLSTPDGARIGWRTEFRSMEVQLTDFENAAFTTFMVLLSRVILSFELVLYVPLSKVDENMRRAHVRDAVRTQRFYFRKFVAPPEDLSDPEEAKAMDEDAHSDCYTDQFLGSDVFVEMTLDEIFHGKGSSFPGLITLCRAYLEYIHCDRFTFRRVDEYLEFISKRARGEILTPAQWVCMLKRSHKPSFTHVMCRIDAQVCAGTPCLSFRQRGDRGDCV
jgi:glutamate--cysteine ligase catalytic subunit